MPQLFDFGGGPTTDEIVRTTAHASLGLAPATLGQDFSTPTLDPWGGFGGSSASPPGMDGLIQTGHNGRPKSDRLSKLDTLGTGNFDWNQWTSSVSNGQIPLRLLTPLQTEPGFVMQPQAASAFDAMVRAAAKAGFHITVTGTYRTLETQRSLYAAYQNGTHPAPAAVPGTSNHGWGLAADLSNPASNPAEFNWLVANAGKFGFSNPFGNSINSAEPWHWEYGVHGSSPTPPSSSRGTPLIGGAGGGGDPNSAAGTKGRRAAPVGDPSAAGLDAPALMYANPGNSVLNMATATASLYAPTTSKPPKGSDTGGSTKKQLYDGFMHAGRPDLAKMVYTKAFDTWVGAESGWQVDAASPPNNNGMPNYGLFQFWAGHDWTSNYLQGGQFTASPFQQAMLVARWFGSLTPDDIRRYASEIKSHTYKGWP